jgi:hypothetical protein
MGQSQTWVANHSAKKTPEHMTAISLAVSLLADGKNTEKLPIDVTVVKVQDMSATLNHQSSQNKSSEGINFDFFTGRTRRNDIGDLDQ